MNENIEITAKTAQGRALRARKTTAGILSGLTPDEIKVLAAAPVCETDGCTRNSTPEQGEKGTDDMTTQSETNLTADRILLNRYHVTTRKALIAAIRDEQIRETGSRCTLTTAAVLLDRYLDAENEKIASGAYDSLPEQQAQFDADYAAAEAYDQILCGICGEPTPHDDETAHDGGSVPVSPEPVTVRKTSAREKAHARLAKITAVETPITGSDDSVPAAVVAKASRIVKKAAKVSAPKALKVYSFTARNGSKIILTNVPSIRCETHDVTSTTFKTVRAAAAAGHQPTTFCPKCAAAPKAEVSAKKAPVTPEIIANAAVRETEATAIVKKARTAKATRRTRTSKTATTTVA